MKQTIEASIQTFVHNYAEMNHCQSDWDAPVMACAAADDPLFYHLKKLISPNHALPSDLLPAAKTVITFFIPFARDISHSNSSGIYASPEWTVAYIETNQLIIDLNFFLHQELGKCGYQSTILPPTLNFDKQLLISDWSHRHAAYIAGLGTFGINHLLITPKGCAGRLGSIISDIDLTPTPRPDYEYCLNKYDGSCGLCLERCPQKALSAQDLNRSQCFLIQQYNDWFHYNDETALDCGKCSTSIPCAFTNPVMRRIPQNTSAKAQD